MSETQNPLPFKPGDWVRNHNHSKVAKVKDVYFDGEDTNAVLLDLILYSLSGDKIGRESPTLGGPRSYEPCCEAQNWARIAKPDFPIQLKWMPTSDGGQAARYWAGEALPNANYMPKPRGSNKTPQSDELRKALELIRDGHNDPRAVARNALKS